MPSGIKASNGNPILMARLSTDSDKQLYSTSISVMVLLVVGYQFKEQMVVPQLMLVNVHQN